MKDNVIERIIKPCLYTLWNDSADGKLIMVATALAYIVSFICLLRV